MQRPRRRAACRLHTRCHTPPCAGPNRRADTPPSRLAPDTCTCPFCDPHTGEVIGRFTSIKAACEATGATHIGAIGRFRAAIRGVSRMRAQPDGTATSDAHGVSAWCQWMVRGSARGACKCVCIWGWEKPCGTFRSGTFHNACVSTRQARATHAPRTRHAQSPLACSARTLYKRDAL